MGITKANGIKSFVTPEDIPTLQDQYANYPKPTTVTYARQGDITTLKIDAVGKDLKLMERDHFPSAKITKGYNLPAHHVIHTVGPIGERPEVLKSCYRSVLDIMEQRQLKTVAFCCVSTGIYGYDNAKAAKVALDAVGSWLREHYDYTQQMERIIFCTFLDKDQRLYEKLLPVYFPEGRPDTTDKPAEME
ncbi:O-acetyl-ADP-ribose deacetylase macrod1 [Mortierella claussenii]|nr:O-acetyl-ADP-ribose deacetylase macrod1 [Mortierella claussenii]